GKPVAVQLDQARALVDDFERVVRRVRCHRQVTERFRLQYRRSISRDGDFADKQVEGRRTRVSVVLHFQPQEISPTARIVRARSTDAPARPEIKYWRGSGVV